MLPLLLFLTTLQDSQSKLPEAKMGMAQLVFLREIKAEDGMSEAKQQELLMGHIAFLKGLWEKGTALMVGPMAEEGPIAGLVVLDVEKAEDAIKIMEDDPFVKAKRLKVDSQGWYFAKNYAVKAPDFMDHKQYWFGLLERPEGLTPLSKEDGEKMQAGHMANIVKMAENKSLLLAGPMAGNTALRGIFIFDAMEKAEIDKLVEGDPLIKAGRLKLTLYKWIAPKGSFLIEK